jgi:hypothetical protein
MTLEKFMKILKKNSIRFERVLNRNTIRIDGNIVVNANGDVFINPADGFSRFHTSVKNPKDLKDVKEDDLKPMIAHYRKFHKHDLLAAVDRIQPFGTDIRYVAANGKTYSIATGMLKALKRDLKKGIEELQR